jgi:SOS-response transcriptional repressor LexA
MKKHVDRRIVAFIRRSIDRRGISPTLREIMVAVDYSSPTSMLNRIRKLVAAGTLVERLDHRGRSLVPAGYRPKPLPVVSDASLTDRQREVMRLILDYREANGIPPTQVQVIALAGMKHRNSLRCPYNALARKGFLKVYGTRVVSRFVPLCSLPSSDQHGDIQKDRPGS